MMNAEYRSSPPKTGNAGFEVSIPAAQMEKLLNTKVGRRLNKDIIQRRSTANNGPTRTRSDPSNGIKHKANSVNISEILQHARITEALSDDPLYFPTALNNIPKHQGRTYRELRDDAKIFDCNKLAEEPKNKRMVTWGIPKVFTSHDECDADGKHVDGVLVLPPGSKQPIYLVANMDENTSPSKLATALTDVLLAHSRPEEERKSEVQKKQTPVKSSLKQKLVVNTKISQKSNTALSMFSPITAESVVKKPKTPPEIKTPRASNITRKEKFASIPTKHQKAQMKTYKSKSLTVSPNTKADTKRRKGFFSIFNFKSPKTKKLLKDQEKVKATGRSKNPYSSLNTPKKKQDVNKKASNRSNSSNENRIRSAEERRKKTTERNNQIIKLNL